MKPSFLSAMKTLALSAAVTAGAACSAAEPKTLLDFAVARWEPARLADAVLVIVDTQREYTDGKLRLPDVDAAVGEIAKLLERMRALGAPVVHVVQQGRPGGAIMDPNGPMVDVIAPLTPRAGEIVVTKRLPNSFAGTALDEELKRLGRKDLIVVGFMTHMCVSTTARATLDQGFPCTLVANGCATRDLPDGMGGVIPAQTVHTVELAALADRFAEVVCDTDDILD